MKNSSSGARIILFSLNLICLSLLFSSCQVPNSKGSLSKEQMNTVSEKSFSPEIKKAHTRSYSYNYGSSLVEVVLLTSAMIPSEVLAWVPQADKIPEKQMNIAIKKIVDATIEKGTCFLFQGQYSFDPKYTKAFVFNSKNEFSWIDFGSTKVYGCADKKMDLATDLTMIVERYDLISKKNNYLRMDWIFSGKIPVSNPMPAEQVFKKYSGDFPQPPTQSLLLDGGPSTKILESTLITNNFAEFKKILPSPNIGLLHSLELSQMYLEMGEGAGYKCSTNKFFKHLETYPIRADVIQSLILAGKNRHYKYKGCPELAQIVFLFDPEKRNLVPLDFRKQIEFVPSKYLSSPDFLKSTLNFYSTIVDYYFTGCQAGAQDQCIYVQRYRQDLLSLKNLISYIRKNELLNKQLEELIRKRKLVRPNEPEQYI